MTVGIAALLMTAGVLHGGSLEQAGRRSNPPLVISSMSGHDLFQFYCSSCHGRDAMGHGPLAPVLRVSPPDLTALAARSGGAFPRERVRSLLTGDTSALPAAHGSQEMPVWGPIFKALAPGDTTNRIRIANIVDYVASIQKP